MKEEKIFSGDNSKSLWDLINSIKRPDAREAVYALGCCCQDFEDKVDRLLRHLPRESNCSDD